MERVGWARLENAEGDKHEGGGIGPRKAATRVTTVSQTNYAGSSVDRNDRVDANLTVPTLHHWATTTDRIIAGWKGE